MLRARLDEQLSMFSTGGRETQSDYSGIELLSVPSDEAFVSEAYRRILGRRPDLEGLNHFVQALKSCTRQAVIDSMTAVRQGAPASREQQPRALASIDLTSLGQVQPQEEFITESYRRILRRGGDAQGLAHYRALLAFGVSRVQVLAAIAASPEAQAQNTAFLWKGAPLPPPRLRLVTRLRLLFWRVTGLAHLEEAIAFARSETAAMRTRLITIEEEVKALSKEVGAARETNALAMETQKTLGWAATARELGHWTEEVREETDAQRRATTDRLDAIAGDIVSLQKTVQAQETEWTRLREGIEPRFDGLLEKLDAIAADIRVRQEGMQAEQERSRVELGLEIAGVRDRADLVALRMRRPVLTGRDLFVTTVNEFILAVPRNDLALAAYYTYWGAVDQGLSHCLASLLRPGGTFVDIGANIGVHSLEAARAVGETGKVYSFEPTPGTFAALQTNLELNGITWVETFRCALLDRQGSMPLYVDAADSAQNSLFAKNEAGSIIVEAMTLDDALRGRENVDVVKIDAEGAEPFILRGMTSVLAANPKLVVIVEFEVRHLSRAGVDPSGFLHELRTGGFEIRRVDDLTGELQIATDEQILSSKSNNLHLHRPQPV